MIGPRILHEINSAHHYNDLLESELTRETENGRIVRLLCKLGFINERPEFDMDPSWSETGDRYLLKLFRDYVFHQVDEMGNPVVDISHVIQCLNKLDVGVDEKIMLTSRDNQSCLVVTYKELKHCCETSFGMLASKGS
ncbi:PAB-dependent poly(A)-specific ribonuclease subunit 3 [Blyttiomyces sp. JEL0837]|nr:PAB-dependent poly(A)-specific ribonuclease subunit 3 [Blyttiomyces sp. JEL0837]